MTKRRAIYSTSATSLSLARCCPEAQLLFDRLIAAADDQGRLQGDALLVRSQCLPLVDKATTRNVDRWLGELTDAGMILRYEAHGQPLVQVVKWWAYQGWMRHIYASRWAAPDGWDQDQVKGGGAGTMTADGRQDAGKMPPDDGTMPQSDGRVPASDSDSGESESESESEIETSASRVAREASTPPPLDIALHKITTTHRDLTGKDPNAKAVKMYADLLRVYGRGNADVITRAMYWCWNAEQSEYGLVGRVKDRLKAAA